MGNVWTGPVKAALTVSVVGIVLACGIAYRNLQVSEQQLQIMQGQAAIIRDNGGSVSPVTINYIPFYVASGLASFAILCLFGTAIYVWNKARQWPYHGEDVGFHLESAMLGAPDVGPKSVLKKVRQLATQSRSIPVNWQLLLGYDPQPHAFKYLTVTISITQIEGKQLELPVLDGSAPRSSANPQPQLSDVEFMRRDKIKHDYGALKWGQKIALKYLCEKPGTQTGELVGYLEGLSFGKDPYDATVGPLLQSGLLHVRLNGDIEVLDLDFVYGLIKERPLC